MEIMQWCKMQIMCLLILAYIGCTYIKEGNDLKKATKKSYCNWLFDINFVVAEIAVLFDAITACTVNFLDAVPRSLNLLLHLGMYVSCEGFIALLFWYWVSATVGIPKGSWVKVAQILPIGIAVGLTVFLLPTTKFLEGNITNYSMGPAVYVCFVTVALYFVFTVGFLWVNRRRIPRRKLGNKEMWRAAETVRKLRPENNED